MANGKPGAPTKHELRYRNSGRPTVMDENTVLKLEQAFSIDANISEACAYAGIARNTFYLWLEANPKFKDRIAALREKPILKARSTIVDNLDNPAVAQWYLSRKRKDEFSERTETTTELTVKVEPSERVKRLADRLNQ